MWVNTPGLTHYPCDKEQTTLVVAVHVSQLFYVYKIHEFCLTAEPVRTTLLESHVIEEKWNVWAHLEICHTDFPWGTPGIFGGTFECVWNSFLGSGVAKLLSVQLFTSLKFIE